MSMCIPSHHRFVDLRGVRFGRLLVVEYAGVRGRRTMWRCRCDCGAEKDVGAEPLRANLTRSCGCLRNDRVRAACETHGLTRKDGCHPLFGVWASMRQRCCNRNNKSYRSYGGRGITICERWQNGDGVKTGFECFVADMGERPSIHHSIDRIDNDGHYEPANCRWATAREQRLNQRPRRVTA